MPILLILFFIISVYEILFPGFESYQPDKLIRVYTVPIRYINKIHNYIY